MSNIGVFLTRFAGTDGVSLQTNIIKEILEERLDHNVFGCAGALNGHKGVANPILHFKDEKVKALTEKIFSNNGYKPSEIIEEIYKDVKKIKPVLKKFIKDFEIDIAIVENLFSIPSHPAFTIAMYEVLDETRIPAIGHHHDFADVRKRFKDCKLPGFADFYYPPILPNLKHVVINTDDKEKLKIRKGLNAEVWPNFWDFSKKHGEGNGFRKAIGVEEDAWIIYHPSRLGVPRKGTEYAVGLYAELTKLVEKKGGPKLYLLFTHKVGDEGFEHHKQILNLIEKYREKGYEINLIDKSSVIEEKARTTADGKKIYSFEDAYEDSDLVAIPSLFEGFGNAFVEALSFKKPVVANNYAVLEKDILPKGFEVILLNADISNEVTPGEEIPIEMINKVITPEVVEKAYDWLRHPEKIDGKLERNFQIGKDNYDMGKLEDLLKEAINQPIPSIPTETQHIHLSQLAYN